MSTIKKGADGLYRLNFSFEGKQYAVRSKDKKELPKKMAQKLKELESGRIILDKNTVFHVWAEQWQKTYKTHLRKSSYDRISYTLENHINPAIGFMRLKDIRQIQLQAILNGLEGYAVDTVKKVRDILIEVFDLAVENNLLLISPAVKLQLPKTKASSTHRSITDRERLILLETARNHPAGLWVKLMLYCGLRPQETAPLQGRNIDAKNHTLKIESALDRRTGEIKTTKSAAGKRTVPIPLPLWEALEKSVCEPMDYILKQKNGKYLTQQTMATLWKSFKAAMSETEKLLIQAGRLDSLYEAHPELVPYDLRHTYCTDLQTAGVPINVAKELMGHSSIELTSRIYTHTSEQTRSNTAALIDALHTDVLTDVTDSDIRQHNTPMKQKA